MEFWDLTPRETYMVIEAAIWRDERAQKQAVAASWRTAALVRARRMPSLQWMLAGQARPLHGTELEERRQEFSEAKATVDDAVLKKATDLARRARRGDTG